MLKIKTLDLDMHTYEWKGGQKLVSHQDMGKSTLYGTVVHLDGTTVDFSTPLNADEKTALRAVLDAVLARVQETLQ